MNDLSILSRWFLSTRQASASASISPFFRSFVRDKPQFHYIIKNLWWLLILEEYQQKYNIRFPWSFILEEFSGHLISWSEYWKNSVVIKFSDRNIGQKFNSHLIWLAFWPSFSNFIRIPGSSNFLIRILVNLLKFHKNSVGI
jgi:hypothetical protein